MTEAALSIVLHAEVLLLLFGGQMLLIFFLRGYTQSGAAESQDVCMFSFHRYFQTPHSKVLNNVL